MKVFIFDWGNTVMRDFPDEQGPMYTWKKVEWIEGAEELLKYLQGKFICAIASNAGQSDTAMMRKALHRVDAEKYFQFFFTSKDLGVEKPNPAFFLHIAKAINAEPQNCIMVGNDYNKDIVGAKEVGMRTIFFNENKLKSSFIKADWVVKKMADIIPICSTL